MSMRSDVVYGYGLDQNDLDKIPDKNFEEFIKKYRPEIWKKVCEDVSSENPSADDIIDYLEEINNWDYNKYCIVADILREETNIEFKCFYFEDQAAVMLPKVFPWETSKEEIALTPSMINDKVYDYLEELGIENAELDIVSVESWG